MSGGDWFEEDFGNQNNFAGEIGQEPQHQPVFNNQQPHQYNNFAQSRIHQPQIKNRRPRGGVRRPRPQPRPVQYNPVLSPAGFYNEPQRQPQSFAQPQQPFVQPHHNPLPPHSQGMIGDQMAPNQFFGDFSSQQMTHMGMAAASTFIQGMQDPSQMANQLTNNLATTLKANSMLSVDYYKRWFQVDNSYVFRKFRLILLPVFHDHWGRQFDPDTGYKAPISDINSPDGYLPTMLYVTYVMLMGYMGATEQNDFSPEVFIKAASTALGMIIFESLMVYKLGLWLTKIVTVQPHFVDLLCYSGYKLVAANSSLVVYLISASTNVYYIVAIVLSLSFGMFVARSLKPYYGNEIQEKFMSPSAQGGIFCVMNIYLFIIIGLQVPIILYLGKSIL